MIDPDELDDGIPDDEAGQAAFVLDNDVMATRLMFRAAWIAEQREKITAQVADQIELAQQYGARLDAPWAKQAEWVDAQLKGYALRVREASKNLPAKLQVKTLRTLWGEVATREQAAKWQVTDHELAVKAARAAKLDQLINTEVIPEQRIEKFDVAAAKKAKGLTVTVEGVFDAKGTALEGISITPATVTATVKPTLGGEAK